MLYWRCFHKQVAAQRSAVAVAVVFAVAAAVVMVVMVVMVVVVAVVAVVVVAAVAVAVVVILAAVVVMVITVVMVVVAVVVVMVAFVAAAAVVVVVIVAVVVVMFVTVVVAVVVIVTFVDRETKPIVITYKNMAKTAPYKRIEGALPVYGAQPGDAIDLKLSELLQRRPDLSVICRIQREVDELRNLFTNHMSLYTG
ncbi:conserved hypothetical protein [Perkinsus marinus ATCC 50983]|uniref:Uncharacterized protein n=1 Tax=Perkinsus marinus (strain ATCC 50983 / TXsc) TaxID=423536 RepID=C5M170_PERM5|nr:conserved hypothetical protein [Perkinsus marinus ATCC 50983]EEQ97300.1 conserved hypothetical protein [Perkinsus marinus ATCC 50983]|eukprot:XP_002764583.1 conserved hypothetical protein [Perkinsus marinus ATCC 50983]